MNILASGEIQCVEICGDGIIINDQCDDGNTLNGDGCSEFCKIEKDWACVNKTKCDLKTKPQMKVVRTVKVDKMNMIEVYLQLTIGLRLIKQNFVLIFSESSVKFSYQIEQLDSKFTQYKLKIDYQATVQNVKLSIKVVSPISQLTSTKSQFEQYTNQRTLQQIQLAIPLEIQLAIELQIDIITQPPATYITTQTRKTFSYVVYIFMAYQIICILLTFWLVYKRINFMLIVIDLITSMRIVYVLATFGMHNISQLVPTVGKGLQPFVYQFGPAIQDIYSAFYTAGYTRLIFSSCCIQIGILLICLAIKYLSQDRQTQNQGHYYLNAFIYCFSIDIYLSCISIISSTQFSSYIGSYSWAFAILILMGLTMHNFMYIAQGKSAIYKNRTILPTKSFATGDLDITKQKQLNNQVLDTSEFHSSHNEGDRENFGDGEVWSEHHTQVAKSQKPESVKQKEVKSKEFTQTKESLLSLISINTGHQYDMHDLAPSVEYSISKAKTFYESSVFYESGSRNKLTLYHLPILNNLLPLLLVLIACLVKSGNNYLLIRSSLLLGLFFVAFVFILLEKPQTIKSSARNIKLIFNYCIYLSICVILVIATATKSQNTNQWIDLSILSIVVLFFIGSLTLWFINLKYSPQYKEYLIDLKNQQIIQRNKMAQQPRKKIYTGMDDKSYNTSPIKNIFRKQPEKYIPQSLQSHSVSQANSVNEENSYYDHRSRHAENVFEHNRPQSPNQQHQYNQRIQFVQPTNDKQPAKQTKIKAINEYDAYLSSYGTFAAVKQPKHSEKITIKNPNPSQLKQKQQQAHEEVRISSNFSQSNSNIINKKSQGNDAIKKSIKLDNQSFIEKNKRVSPRKISTLAKVQRKDDNLNHNSLILDNDLSVVNQGPGRKISKRIDGNTDEKLLGLIKDQQQKSELSQKHYMYQNPASQSALSKSKSKSKGKSSGSLHFNKSLPKKLKNINNATAHLDQKIIMLEQLNNPRNNLTQVSDFVDNQTNQPNESRSKPGSKITDYSLLMNNAQLKKQMLEDEQSLQVQRQRTGEVKSSFSQRYQELNRQYIKHGNEEISSGLSDDLSDEDYDLEFPTGINSRARNQKKSEVQNESRQQNRPKKLKKPQSQQRGVESKMQSREKKHSISPSKLSVYQRPHLEDISSIHEQGQQVFSEVSQLGIEDDLNVYNKILKDHQKYKDKKVDKKLIEKELRRKDHNDSYEQDSRN